MFLYAIIMFLAALLFGIMSMLIYKGKTNLIHDYHQTKVKDKKAYGRAFGHAMGIHAVTLALSGIVATLSANLLAIGILVIGLVVGGVCIYRVQKKFNGGLF
jgi:hypothetical protein